MSPRPREDQPHQLSGLDAEFLAMESSTVYAHVASVCRLDPSTAPQPLTLATLTALIAARLHLVPLFRRTLLRMPFGLDQPYWVEDHDVALEYHVREIALPAPGDDAQLLTQVARLHARPLDRSRPLWEIYLITGLRDGRAAIYGKVHHAAMDGVSGDDLLAALLDQSPEGRDLPPTPPAGSPQTEPGAPGRRWLLRRTARSLAAQPVRALKLGADLLRHAPGIIDAVTGRLPTPDPRAAGDQVDDAAARPALRAPHTPFNASVSAHRRVAIADLPFDRIRHIKRAAGVTVNDVVMALCAGALRRWLIDHDALPHAPLIAAVPLSVRTRDDRGSFGNRIAFTLARLPTDIDDPSARLRAAHTAMQAAKHDIDAVGPELLADASAVALPVVANVGWQVAARLRLLERVNPFNLFISNVPGPRVPLYYSGARVLAYHPFSAIADGQGLNVTVVSYTDRMCFGLVACRTLVPDLDSLAGYLADDLDALSSA